MIKGCVRNIFRRLPGYAPNRLSYCMNIRDNRIDSKTLHMLCALTVFLLCINKGMADYLVLIVWHVYIIYIHIHLSGMFCVPVAIIFPAIYLFLYRHANSKSVRNLCYY